MRPDRIIVGEVRAEEALDMLQAMNTGHDGSLTTIHANTPRDALGRLEVMVGMANANMGIRSIRQQMASAVDLFVQVARFSDGSRRITHITEVVGMEQDIITLQDIFLFEKTGIAESGKGHRAVSRHRHPPPLLRAPQSVRHQPAAPTVPDGGGDQLMPAGVIVSFVVVFALTMLAVSMGLKFFDARRKTQMTDMLHTAAGEPVVAIENLLKELNPDSPLGIQGPARLVALHASRPGADSAGGLELVFHAAADHDGLGGSRTGVGTMFPFLVNGPITAVVLGLVRLRAAVPVRAAQAPEAPGYARRAISRRRSIFCRVPCGPAMPSPSAWKWWARKWPIHWARNSARSSTSRTWARRSMSRCAISACGCRCSTCASSLHRCCCKTDRRQPERDSHAPGVRHPRALPFEGPGEGGQRPRAADRHHFDLAADRHHAGPAGGGARLFARHGADSDGKWMIGGAIVAQILGNFFIKKIINIKV
jgi:hypothetical protein